MKLLCDVCEKEAARLICCADQAALCLACDSRIHAANKLAGKHQRVPILAEPLQPAVCDICQDQPSFFFCIEDRALLCRDCDASIHSVNALAAKHRRFLLTGIQVGSSCISNSTSPEQTSAISLEQYVPSSSPSHRALVMAMKQKPAAMEAVRKTTIMSHGVQSKGLCESIEPSYRATKRPFKSSASSSPVAGCGKNINAGLCVTGAGSKAAIAPSCEKLSASGATTVRTPLRYMMNKQGTLSMPSDSRNTETSNNRSSKSTTISIRRISAGRVPFVAPVLSSLSEALKQENVCNSIVSDPKQQEEAASIKSSKMHSSNGGDGSNHLSSDNINSAVTMEADDSPPASSENVSDYLVSGASGWRLDELLTDLIGVYDSGPSPSPTKEGNAGPGYGIQQDPSWYAEVDFMAEHSNLISLAQSEEEEGEAMVPDVPICPPTASGMVTSHSKPTCPAAAAAHQPWEFDYLFTDYTHDQYPSEFSVVPDIDGGGGRRPSPTLITAGAAWHNSKSGYGGKKKQRRMGL